MLLFLIETVVEMAWFTKRIVVSLYSTTVVIAHGMLLQVTIVWVWSFVSEWQHEGHLDPEHQCVDAWSTGAIVGGIHLCLCAGWIVARWQPCQKGIWLSMSMRDTWLSMSQFWWCLMLDVDVRWWCGFFCVYVFEQSEWHTGREECDQQAGGSCCHPLLSAGEVCLEYFVRNWGSCPLLGQAGCEETGVCWEAETVGVWMVWHARGTWRELDLFGLRMKSKRVSLQELEGQLWRWQSSVIIANDTVRESIHKLQLERLWLGSKKHCSCGQGWLSRTAPCPRGLTSLSQTKPCLMLQCWWQFCFERGIWPRWPPEMPYKQHFFDSNRTVACSVMGCGNRSMQVENAPAWQNGCLVFAPERLFHNLHNLCSCSHWSDWIF